MKISLITVSFNSEKTIKQTFESIKKQHIKGFELEYILIDGLSSDSTIELSKCYDNLITFRISEKDSGIYNAMNKGVKLATGDIIGFINSDDEFHENNILLSIANTFINNNIDIVYGDINYINQSGKIIRKWVTGNQKSFASGWHPPHPAFYAKKSLFTKHGDFDETLSVSSDFDLMLRFMEVSNSNSKYLDMVFVDMKIGGESNKSLKNIIKGNHEIIKSFKKYGINPNPVYKLRRWLKKLKQYLKN